MTIKSGFFNSLNHDRMYDADDMNAIFDGIITDGVFGNIGNKFIVTPGSGMTINIGTGKARLHQIFVENDANLVLQVSQSDVLLNRIDVVVIRVDKTISGRRGDITILKGTPSQNPIAPTLSTDGQIWEMPIAYINVNANASKIGPSDIQYLVGRNSTPLITAPMQTVNVESYVGKMEGQFSDWFSNLKDNLSTNAAGNLQNQINTINPKVSSLSNELKKLADKMKWKYLGTLKPSNIRISISSEYSEILAVYTSKGLSYDTKNTLVIPVSNAGYYDFSVERTDKNAAHTFRFYNGTTYVLQNSVLTSDDTIDIYVK